MAKRTKKAQAAKNAPQPADAVQLLKADHRRVRTLFDQFREAPDDKQSAIAGRLFAELDIHSKLEEELLYPAVQDKLKPLESETLTRADGLDAMEEDEEEDIDGSLDQVNGIELEAEDEDLDEETESEEVIAAAYESHRTVNDLIQQLRSLDSKDEDYRELFDELEEAVIEHVAEEEADILPVAASTLDVQALGLEMQRRKDDLSSQSSLAA